MKQNDNNQTEQVFTKVLMEMIVKTYQALKTYLWFYYFMALKWITGTSKDGERHYTSGIGLS